MDGGAGKRHDQENGEFCGGECHAGGHHQASGGEQERRWSYRAPRKPMARSAMPNQAAPQSPPCPPESPKPQAKQIDRQQDGDKAIPEVAQRPRAIEVAGIAARSVGGRGFALVRFGGWRVVMRSSALAPPRGRRSMGRDRWAGASRGHRGQPLARLMPPVPPPGKIRRSRSSIPQRPTILPSHEHIMARFRRDIMWLVRTPKPREHTPVWRGVQKSSPGAS